MSGCVEGSNERWALQLDGSDDGANVGIGAADASSGGDSVVDGSHWRPKPDFNTSKKACYLMSAYITC